MVCVGRRGYFGICGGFAADGAAAFGVAYGKNITEKKQVYYNKRSLVATGASTVTDAVWNGTLLFAQCSVPTGKA